MTTSLSPLPPPEHAVSPVWVGIQQHITMLTQTTDEANLTVTPLMLPNLISIAVIMEMHMSFCPSHLKNTRPSMNLVIFHQLFQWQPLIAAYLVTNPFLYMIFSIQLTIYLHAAPHPFWISRFKKTVIHDIKQPICIIIYPSAIILSFSQQTPWNISTVCYIRAQDTPIPNP